MRSLFGLILAIILWPIPGWASGPPTRLIQGRTYFPIPEWAGAGGFRWGWARANDEVWVTNRWARMRFVVDSRRAEFNGIAVWLSEPVARRNTIPHLACIDAETLLNPLFHPPKVPPGARIRTVCLDPGHGGRDPGNQAGTWQEKKLAFQLAMEVREMLMAAGLKVVMTRTNDTFIEKLERPEIAARKGADLFVSLHFNSAPDLPAVRGAEVYCLTPPGASSTNSGGEGSSEGPSVGNRQNDINLVLAYEIQKALVRGLGLEDRGVRRARFAVLRPTRMPAVLVESAFMTNASDLRRMTDARGRRELALAITDGVLSAKRLLERGEGARSAR